MSLAELRADKPQLERGLLSDPLRHIRAIETVLADIASEERPGYDKHGISVKVAIEGPISSTASSPRSLRSDALRSLVCVDGVATKVSGMKPKLVKSVHYCPATMQHLEREYVDATHPQLGLPATDATGRELPDRIINLTTSTYPTTDADKNPLETEFGLSQYKDHQTICLQEMPEKAPMGQLPRSIECILEHDLVDKVKPGDRIRIVGVYRALSTSIHGQATTSGVFQTVILVNHVAVLGRHVSPLSFTPSDIPLIKTLSKRPDILNLLGQSMAPSIHGHGKIKQALALQLLSGCEKNLENGTHLRGDINILLVGDPSTAKSQLLRAMMIVAPLSVSTTGKGSSGVGLTAAVTSDPDTKERRLEAGAMVLADRGIVCVDEFDKMGEGDRVAIHEAMEQQTVTIAKAGIHASLNARCSVLAAANPVYGQYDKSRRIQENIGLPDSLLSRFDLLFVVLDQLDPEADRRIASHVIRGHKYKPTQQECALDSDEEDEDDAEEEEGRASNPNQGVWQRSRYANTGDENSTPDDVLQHEFLRKYLHFAKTRMKPTLTEEARECIVSRYAEMRGRQNERTLPITARSLETIIRLATAHAKARLSHTVEADPDCTAAMDILSFALYHENSTLGPEEAAPDLTQTDSEDEQQEPKRIRLTEEDDTPPSDLDLTSKVWNELVKAGGQVDKDDICTDVTDRALIEKVYTSLEKDNKVMIDGDTIYQI